MGGLQVNLVFLHVIHVNPEWVKFARGQKERKPEINKYLKSVNILLILIAIVGVVLVFFM